MFLWDAALQDFSATLPSYNAAAGNWVPNATINPGTGFFVFAPTPYTNTFVGEVLQQGGITPVPIPSNFGMIASQPPIGGNVGTVLTGLPAADNDLALKWDTTAQDFTTIATYSAASSSWVPGTVQFGVAEGILYFHNGASVNWVRNFTVTP